MKKKQRLVFRSILLVIVAVAVGYTLYNNVFNDKSGSVQKGDQAPDFELTDLQGNKVQLSDYKGKGVFLNFWGTWCKPCQREMPYMQKEYRNYKKQGVEILAVNVGESRVSVKNFADRFHLSFPIPLDGSREVTKAYGIGPIPTTFLVDKNGKVIEITSESLSNETIKSYMEKIKP
ncbi:thiol-disulfide oxidoreductase ResA [Fictibacillus enclensis]|uniref:Thiol-disulfide oxidoreductase n=1 Tax=Fictibacillus enclensis TaxID=1017270 RepID=A0A0V8JEW3_9BACL|nr:MULTISPECIES: thiol-disulfide oxidoreductase ResA [Fictibacillus]KSU85623.1 thiol-disulfide oxidoreductase [Fictibacillus enclensis]MDM5338803.1 thiol-disulfide oxidoreductase ResA [Fictibacillus enclensis]RXY98683.1 thiol-disulfide oxidoreductase [Fictibacillus sp. S7]WHY70299.1 thiol-disulfide oxidoreductase ResA [Fictibacillus enclensis]SCB99880.1 Peroxiredoxin [Fictibacillus enclensis]